MVSRQVEAFWTGRAWAAGVGAGLVAAASIAAALGAGSLAAPSPAENPAENPPELVARFRAHYGAVLSELRAADTSHLAPAQQASRAFGLALLADYRERGEFGVNADFPGARVPYFVDASGRRCALAHLLDGLGETLLVADIAATQNHDYVVDLAASRPEMVASLAASGFSVADAARIHAPSGGGTLSSSGRSSAGGSGPQGPSFSPPSPATTGASTTGTAWASKPKASGAPATTGPGSPLPATTGSRPSRDARRGAKPAAATTGSAEAEAWWSWWEMNKLRFLANESSEAREPQSASVSRGRYATRHDRARGAAGALRAELLPRLAELTRDGDAMVRARAAVTLGRLGGPPEAEELDALLPLLGDASASVRHAALLGLGASGTMRGASVLLNVVKSGCAPDGRTVTPWARQVALVALGVGRRHGLGEPIDVMVAGFVSGFDDDERRTLAPALLAYQSLAGTVLDAQEVAGWLGDARQDWTLRCRAAENLPLYGDPALLSQLTRALGDADLQVRRSAALAMGALPHPLALAALKTATELESEPVARGFALLSLGEQGGPAERDFLRRALDDGDSSQRPFAALGLGLLARRTGDEAARRALREKLAATGSHELKGALTLALGLARDVLSAGELAEQVAEAADPRQRGFAAVALALLGETSSLPALREALGSETSPLALVGLAQALGSFGHEQDAPALLDTLRRARSPETQAHVAVALGFHGTLAAVRGLVDVVSETRAPSDARAAAVEALGLLLDEQPGLSLVAMSASANFEAFPDWMTPLLERSTL